MSRALSQDLEIVIEKLKSQRLTMGEFIHILGVHAHPFVILVIGLPFCLPIPTFGLSAVFGVVLIFSGIGIIFDIPIWLPKKLNQKKLPKDGLLLIFEKSLSFIKKIEKFIKPRGARFVGLRAYKISAGILIIISAVLLALPLPPGTNTPPAVVIVLFALSILEEDVVCAILGGIAFIVQIVLFWTFFYLIKEFFFKVLSYIGI